jgi:hypothetical protein
VRWDRSRRWEGIAGKFTAKGVFTAGGTKETAYAVYSALTDRNDQSLRLIRSPPQSTETRQAVDARPSKPRPRIKGVGAVNLPRPTAPKLTAPKGGRLVCVCEAARRRRGESGTLYYRTGRCVPSVASKGWNSGRRLSGSARDANCDLFCRRYDCNVFVAYSTLSNIFLESFKFMQTPIRVIKIFIEDYDSSWHNTAA